MFVGNGQMAILSGFLVYTLVEGLSLGPMRPSEQINFQTLHDAKSFHVQRGYDEEWLGGTFSQAVFVGNGLMAILSGFLAHTLVEGLSLGPVAPFDAAHAVLLLGGIVVLATWTENFGDESKEQNPSLICQISAALSAIRRGAEIPCVNLHHVGCT